MEKAQAQENTIANVVGKISCLCVYRMVCRCVSQPDVLPGDKKRTTSARHIAFTVTCRTATSYGRGETCRQIISIYLCKSTWDPSRGWFTAGALGTLISGLDGLSVFSDIFAPCCGPTPRRNHKRRHRLTFPWKKWRQGPFRTGHFSSGVRELSERQTSEATAMQSCVWCQLYCKLVIRTNTMCFMLNIVLPFEYIIWSPYVARKGYPWRHISIQDLRFNIQDSFIAKCSTM